MFGKKTALPLEVIYKIIFTDSLREKLNHDKFRKTKYISPNDTI